MLVVLVDEALRQSVDRDEELNLPIVEQRIRIDVEGKIRLCAGTRSNMPVLCFKQSNDVVYRFR